MSSGGIAEEGATAAVAESADESTMLTAIGEREKTATTALDKTISLDVGGRRFRTSLQTLTAAGKALKLTWHKLDIKCYPIP